MKIANLIRKRPRKAVATAIPAIPATELGSRAASVAKVATVAVATPPQGGGANVPTAAPATRTRTATVIERGELLALIQAIYAADTDQDRQEAIDAALLDPEGALTCYRAIANERGIDSAALLEVRTPARTEPTATGCKTCRHRRRPGRADPGYCSRRADLPPAYGANHPLRKLPDDQGATCASYMPMEN